MSSSHNQSNGNTRSCYGLPLDCIFPTRSRHDGRNGRQPIACTGYGCLGQFSAYNAHAL